MSNIFELKKQCLAKIEEAFQIAEKHYGVEIPRIPVEFSNKLTSTAGTASYRRHMFSDTLTPGKIKLSTKILMLNPEEFVARTPGHEAAHIIDYVVFNNAGHGRTWKEIMRLIGQDASRCHSMETPKTNKVAAYCGCDKTNYISKQRAGKMRNGTARYGCRICKQSLTLTASHVKHLELTAPQMGIAADAPKAATKPKATPKKVTPKKVVTKKGKVSKADQVRAIIKANQHETVAHIVSIVIAQVDLTPALAKTYVKNNMKKLGL